MCVPLVILDERGNDSIAHGYRMWAKASRKAAVLLPEAITKIVQGRETWPNTLNDNPY